MAEVKYIYGGQNEANQSAGKPVETAAPRAVDIMLRGRIEALESMLVSNQRIRASETENELVHLLANDVRKFAGARQVFVLKTTSDTDFEVCAVSSLALVDKDTPLIRGISNMASTVVRKTGGQEAQTFLRSEHAPNELTDYPFQAFIWQPLASKSGKVFAGLLVARERQWSEAETNVVKRQADNAAVAWMAMLGPKMLAARPATRRRWWWLAGAAVAMLAITPVPMTTLAPVEIVAAQPQRITAPIDGVIAELPVQPNAPVKKGDVILRLDATTLENRANIAAKDLEVAQSRYDRAQQAAFSDEKARHELAIARNDFLLKQAELDFARSQLAKTVIHASRDGLLIYGDRHKLLGHPVRTGERLMEIADPKQAMAEIQVPVADAIVLEKGTNVRLFLDSNPLSALPMTLATKAYQAEPTSTQKLAYRVTANFRKGEEIPRIGTRGTAQLVGDWVPLAYFLMRRPISAVRQHMGI